ncbi:hypothetical protein [Vreelandella sp. GE22]
MVDIAAFLGFLIFTPGIMRNLYAESVMYDEFGRQKTLLPLLVLLPVAPLLLVGLTIMVSVWAGIVVAGLCFLLVLLMARKDVAVFDTSGTSRTDKAKNAAHMAFGAALAGLLYVALYALYPLTVGNW